MNIWVHLGLAVLLTAYFAFRFWRDRQLYQLLFVIWVPSTLLAYVSTNAAFRVVLAAFQIIMFLLVLFFMFRKPKTPLLVGKDREDGEQFEDDTAEDVPDDRETEDGDDPGEPASPEGGDSAGTPEEAL